MKPIAEIKQPDIVKAVEAATNKLPNKEKLRISVSFLDEKGRHWQINPSECGVCHISMVFVSESHIKIWFDEEAIFLDLKSKDQDYVRKVKERLERIGYHETGRSNMYFIGYRGCSFLRSVLKMKKEK